MRTFIMGDIHGAHKALLQCLTRAGFNKTEDCLIQLGDVVDGHPDAYECVEELLSLAHLIPILGNHDRWFRDFIETGIHPREWRAGCKDTAFSYLKKIGRQDEISHSANGYKTTLSPNDIPARHKELFVTMKTHYIDENRNCFLHGGFERDKLLNEQDPERFYWNRSLWTKAMSFAATQRGISTSRKFSMKEEFRKVFIGHTNLIEWKTDKPLLAANIWNLDSGAGYKGRLTIMNLETEEYWQSDPVDDLYKK